MKSKFSLIAIIAVAIVSSAATYVSTKISETKDSLILGRTGDKIAFFGGATPVVKPASANDAAAAAQTQDTLTDSSGGTASTTIASITAGGTYAQADLTALKNAVATFAAENAKIKTDVAALRTLLNQIRADLVALALIKGSA